MNPEFTVQPVVPGDLQHARLMEEMMSEPLASQWWVDAESRAEPDVSYMVAYVTDGGGEQVASAWAGWIVESEAGRPVLRCCDNYVRHGYRGRVPELYALVYRARHREVVRPLGLHAVTYLYPEPVGLHLGDGWWVDTSPGSAGTSRPEPDGPVHHWQRLRWSPPSTVQDS